MSKSTPFHLSFQSSYALSTVKKHTEWSNANGRGEGNIQHVKKTLPPAVFALYERAEAAHKNSMESLPLFIAATLSGVFAEKLTRTDVGNAQFSAAFLGIRVLYTLLYVSGFCCCVLLELLVLTWRDRSTQPLNKLAMLVL